VMQLKDLWTLGQRVRNAVVPRGSLAPDSHEGQHRLVQRVWIDKRGIAANDAASFELANTFQHGRRGETDDSRHISLRNPGIFLKKIQYYGVCVVYHSVIMS